MNIQSFPNHILHNENGGIINQRLQIELAGISKDEHVLDVRVYTVNITGSYERLVRDYGGSRFV